MSRRQDGLMAKLLDGFMAMAMWLDGNSPSIHLTIDEMAIWLWGWSDMAIWLHGLMAFWALEQKTEWLGGTP